MERRTFTRIALGSAAAAALPGSLGAELPDDRDRSRPAFARVTLLVAAQQVLLTWFLVYHATQVFGLDLRNAVPRYEEDRMDLGAVPLLGGLQRPMLSTRFRDSVPVGELVLLGTILILLTSPGFVMPRRTVITHRDESWEPPGRLRPVSLQGLPPVSQLQAQPRVGDARAARDEMLVRVLPSRIRF